MTAYGIRYGKGDNLKIAHSNALLPVHRAWLLLIGLIGRYRARKDHAIRARRHSFDSTQVSSDISTYASRPDGVWHELHGRSGKLQHCHVNGEDPVVIVRLTTASVTEIDKDVPSHVSTKRLLMLAFGLMPLTEEYSFGLHDPLDEGDAGSLSEWGSSDDDDVPVTNGVTNRRMDQLPPTLERGYEERATLQEVQVYHFVSAQEHTSVLHTLGRSFGIDTIRAKVISEFTPSRSLSHDLRHYEQMTYVPSNVPWIRLPRKKGRASCYVARADAHRAAQSLLNLPWHPHGFILGGSSASIGSRLLTNAASRFLRIARRVKHSVDNIGLEEDQKSTLKNALAPAIRCIERKAQLDRSAAGIFYRLDQVLEGLCRHNNMNHIVERMIETLMLLHPDFQDLFHQSLRHLNRTVEATIRVDIKPGYVVVPSAFGGLQTFELDLDNIFTVEERNQDALDVPYSTVVIASLRACTRSRMLSDCHDARPLTRFIISCPEVVLVE